jgi:hypothetical protein
MALSKASAVIDCVPSSRAHGLGTFRLVALRAIACYEIAVGVISGRLSIHHTPNNSAYIFNVYSFFACAISVGLGLSLWSAKSGAWRRSLVFQALQAPRFLGSAFSFAVLVGADFELQLRPPLASLWGSFGVVLRFAGLHKGEERMVGLNLVAALITILVWVARPTPRANCAPGGDQESGGMTEGG